MPPKAARGAARGRGRGRGRGKAAAADVPSASAPGPKGSDPESQSTTDDTPMADAELASNTTPLNELADEQHDPNSSPATQPTETPAPTPVRLPPASNTNAVASSSGARGAETAKPPRFKPRIARTNAKEREEREAREREKENARLGAIAYATRANRATWGRGRGGRGRGDAMGRGRMQTGGTASGPFAEVASSGARKSFFSGAPKSEGGSAFSRGPAGGGGGPSIPGKPRQAGSNSGGSGATLNPVSGLSQPEPQYPDDDGDAPRVDIEHINQSSDSEDDVVITGARSVNRGKGKTSNKGGLKPIRLDRKEHKERGTVVNTDAVIKTDPEEKDLDAIVIDERRSSRAAKKKARGTDDGDVKIKSEPGVVPQMIYTAERTASSPPPPDFKASDETRAEDSDAESEHPELERAERAKPARVSPSTERRSKPRASKKTSKMPIIQTEEDRAEWTRHLEDVEILRKELGGMAASLRPKEKEKEKDVEGDINMEGPAAEEEPRQELEDGRVYLFQFPPVLPKLFNDQTTCNPNYDDFEMMAPVDLTRDDKEIKSEEVVEVKQEEPDEEELRRRHERDKLVMQEGAVGKLVLRESGEVEMVWGGTNMKVHRGIETSFFSLGAVVDGMMYWRDEKPEDIPANFGKRGKSMAMGEIMGKFVVTPDWSRVR